MTGEKEKLLRLQNELRNIKENDKKSIYIVNSFTDTIPGQLIQARAKLKFWNRYDGDHYTHVSISKDLKLDNMFSFARKKIDDPFDCGMIKENIREGMFEKNILKSEIAVMNLEMTEEQYNKLLEITDFYWNNKDNYNYNYLGLISMLFIAKGVPTDNRFFCSQWVAKVLNECGIDLFNGKKSYDIRPFDFYCALKNNIVYEGLVSQYPFYDLEKYEENFDKEGVNYTRS